MGLAFVGMAIMAANLFYCLWKYRKKIGSLLNRAAASKAAAAAASSGGNGENEDDDDDEGNAKGDIHVEVDTIASFLDAGHHAGLDDSDMLEINPVMLYRMNMAKKKARAAARAAQLGVSEDELAAADNSGGGGGTGRPGGLARLGFVLKKGGKGKDDDKKNMSKEVKGIEMFLAREEDINVRHDEEEHHTIAGSKGGSLMEIATSEDHTSNLGRFGGRRGSVIAAQAREARQQLKVIKETKADLFAKLPVSRNSCDGGRASRISQMAAADAAYRKSVIQRMSKQDEG